MAATAIGAAVSLGTAYMGKKQADKQMKMAQKGIEASDPFAQYRPEYGKKLQELMMDPSSIVNTPEYKARQEAAARAMSAQGYTGSGNAIIEAATAGGESFQQAYNNLSQLAGVSATPGAGYSNALQTAENVNTQKMGNYADIAQNLGSMAERYFPSKTGSFTPRVTMNQPATISPVQRQPLEIPKPTIDLGGG